MREHHPLGLRHGTRREVVVPVDAALDELDVAVEDVPSLFPVRPGDPPSAIEQRMLQLGP